MNEPTAYVLTDGSSRQDILNRIDWLLDLLDKEHKHANTHAQRNNYQAVIRHELEVLKNDISRSPRTGEEVTDIPF